MLPKKSSKISRQSFDLQAKGLISHHCKSDHLSPTSSFPMNDKHSSYQANFSSQKKEQIKQDQLLSKQLYQMRKQQQQNSCIALPTISHSSSYHMSFHENDKPIKKGVRGKEKTTHFIKMPWPMNPKSVYENDFNSKIERSFKDQQLKVPNYQNSHIFDGHKGLRHVSSYRNDFHPLQIKKEAQISVGNKDHLGKQNYPLHGVSQYRQRYDSLIEEAKPINRMVSLYGKKVSKLKQNL